METIGDFVKKSLQACDIVGLLPYISYISFENEVKYNYCEENT